MRSPTRGCWRTKAHSRSSSGPALCRISSGTASLPRSWSCAARTSSSSSSRRSPSFSPVSTARDPTLSRCIGRSGSRSESASSSASIVRSVSIRRRVLLRVQPLVCHVQRVARVDGLLGKQHGAERASDLEPDSSFRECRTRLVDQWLRLAFDEGHDEAELVAAQAGRRSPRRSAPSRASSRGGPAGRLRRGGRTCRCTP